MLTWQELAVVIPDLRKLSCAEIRERTCHMYYIGLDVRKKMISYCVKNASGQVHQEGKVGATRWELDAWMETLPQPWTVAMEATICTGWIYDHL